MNWELPDVQAGFRKGRGTRDQIANIHWIIEKARGFQKNIYCFIDYTKAFDCVDHNKLWKILQEMGIPDHLSCLLRNLYAGQETTVRTGHGTTDWLKVQKGGRQDCIVSPCSFNFYAEYISRNVSTSCEMNHKSESRLPEGRWTTSNMYHSNGRKWRGTKEPLHEDERGEWKSWLRQSHCWAYTLRKPELKETHVPQCSS